MQYMDKCYLFASYMITLTRRIFQSAGMALKRTAKGTDTKDPGHRERKTGRRTDKLAERYINFRYESGANRTA